MGNLRYALRSLLKQPLFSGVVVLTLALGIGANAAVFTVLDAVLLRPLPFHQPQNLVAIGGYDLRERKDARGYRRLDVNSVSYPNFVDWRTQNSVFERIAVHMQRSFTLTDGKEAVHLQAGIVSADMFPLLGTTPILGRAFLPDEDEPGNRVAVLSYGLWQNRFAGDREIIGKSITLDGEQFQLVGVMPAQFAFPIGPNSPEVWTTMSILRESRNGVTPMTEQRDGDFLRCIARLKSNTSIKEAQANLDTFTAALRRQYPDTSANLGVKVLPLPLALVAGAHSALIMLCAMAGCVLLVACVNVANLLLARSVSRQKEISIRAAMGAGRWHIIRQLLMESAVLGARGGAGGLLAAIWGLEALRPFLPTNIPRIGELSPDMRVLAFTGIVSLGAGMLAALLPAWRASHPDLTSSLNEISRGSSESRGVQARSALVVVEIVLALVLLASAGLLVETLLRLQRVQPGFNPSHVMTARIALPEAVYPTPETTAAFYRNLLDRFSRLPGVDSASAAWWVPLSGSEIEFSFDVQERPLPKAEQPIAQVNVISNDYFKTMRVPLLRGRQFTTRDDQHGKAVMIVTESFAKQFFPGADPVGKHVTVNGSVRSGEPPVREIVGVAGDMHLVSLREAPKPQIYLPHQQFAISSLSIFVRTQIDPNSLSAALRRTVSEVDKDVPIYRTRLLSDYLSQSVAQPRLNAMLVGLFAAISLLLAAAGVFGVMSYSVTQRAKELGIRMALGARRTDVLRLVVKQGMQIVAVGMVLGLFGVFACTRLLQSLLYGVGATDLPTLLSVSLTLSVVALLACLIPALRASRVDPIVALRSE
jgi:predicted permease